MRAALGLAVMVALAGCDRPPEGPPAFDGHAALGFVEGLVRDAAGEPRFRVPGTQGHAEAAAWLWEAMQVPGWTAQWQNFTGGDYALADKGQVAAYYDNAGACTPEEKARLATLSFHNLWAVHDAPDSDRLVLLGAHWESKRFANQDADPGRRGDPVLGANDGASGVGVLLQMMRHVPTYASLPFDVGVAFFDGEDGFDDCHPLAGSIHFVSRLQPGDVDRFLLLDMVGDPGARFVREGHSEACDPGLVDLLHEHGQAGPLAANFPGTRKPVADDHLPFIDAGIPAADLIDFGRTGDRTQSISGFPPYWHTTGDTLDKLDGDMLGHVGDLVLAVLQDDAFAEGWPATCAT